VKFDGQAFVTRASRPCMLQLNVKHLNFPMSGSACAGGDAHPGASEVHLLLACARQHNHAHSPSQLQDLLDHPIEWNALTALAARHRVRPLLHEALAAANWRNVPAEVRESLRAFAESNLHRNLFLLRELLQLLEAFRSHAIGAAPFKGPMLAAVAYGGFARREAGDLDVLVRQRDIAAAKALLESLGHAAVFPTATARESAYLRSLTGRRQAAYLSRHSEHHLVRERGTLNIDLHWALTLREFSLGIRPDELWSWLVPVPLAGRTMYSFAPEELLLVLCINGAKDCWGRLDRVCDVAQLLDRHPSLDWGRVFGRAKRIGALRMVRLGARLAADLLGARLPEGVEETVRRDELAGKLARQVCENLFGPVDGGIECAALGKSLFHLRARERLADRAGYCLRHLEPTVGDWAAMPLPGAMSFLHYIVRPFRLAGKGLGCERSLRKF